ncbi:MAG: isopentenyl-diphosphate Delta-isomerase [Patescibacteria group bacterium]|nr:isopentenyl-diphosphate Delta-isomerase [Patescibacteria group bacterium]
MINLVNEQGNRIGAIDKLEAHVKAKLHEAFSIFIFNSKNELLLQQRAKEKYHSGGLWSNTVCSHAEVGEDLSDATQRRLKEEMGFTTPTNEIFSFVYRSDYENGLTEHEFDHVFIGYYDDQPTPDPEEVMDYKWMDMDDLKEDIRKNPDHYTTWFRKILENEKYFKALTLSISG